MDAVQKRLNDLGVRDIKFFFTPSVKTMPNSQVKREVAFILNTYLDGYRTPFGLLGDTPV